MIARAEPAAEGGASTATGAPLIANLQLLRGVAALMIVLVHLWPLLAPLTGRQGAPQFLYAGVDIFFVISGFIMVHVTTARAVTAPRFALDRVIRIVPVYWLFSLTIFAAAWLLPFLGGWRPGIGDLIRSMLFIPYGEAPNFPPVVYVGWTLNLEMYFYALFTVALALARGGAGQTRLLIAMLLVPVIVAPASAPGSLLRFYGDPVVLEFAIGMIVASQHQRLARLPAAAGFGAIAAAVAMLVADPFGNWGESRFWPFALPSALLVVGAIVLERRGWRSASVPVLQFGAISYVLYVSHPLVLSAFGNVQERVAALQTPGAALGWSAVAVVGATTFAWIVHHAFEQPVARALRRRMTGGVVRARAS